MRRAFLASVLVAAKTVLGMEVRPGDASRSKKWPAFSKSFLKDKSCAVCDRKTKLNAHHVKPFHLFPELELVESNLIALCIDGPGSTNCHCLVGHCGDWKDYNPTVRSDAAFIRLMLQGKVEG